MQGGFLQLNKRYIYGETLEIKNYQYALMHSTLLRQIK